MTSHDREFMNRIVSKICEIDGGEITVYSGNYDFYERERATREANREGRVCAPAGDARQGTALHRALQDPRRQGAQVQSRIKALDKIEKIELPKRRVVVKFDFRDPPRSGDQVAVIEHLSKSYGKRVIYDDFSLTIRRGERWAVMGRNGAGKTTLLKILSGNLTPDDGEVGWAPASRWATSRSSRSTSSTPI
jgi:ATPase subunit of ABC transporter with duplicated ATPase domains